MDKSVIKKSNSTSERQLTEIFERQYNDIFCEILKLDPINFTNLLQKQVLVYLSLTKKQVPQFLYKKLQDIFSKKYAEEKARIEKDFKQIKSLKKDQLDYLSRYNCIIHCPKCINPLHTCGSGFVLYGDHVYCLYCSQVYNVNQVNMYCDKCDVEYYSKLREIVDFNLESFYLISICDYHCHLEEEETIKCPECEMDLYADLKNQNNLNKIEEVTCLYCNLSFDISLFSYECKICGQYFKSEAKIYNFFNDNQKDLICRIHALSNKKYAAPPCLLNKTCECNLNDCVKYIHSDHGILYEGERTGEKVIVCDKCLKIFNYYSFVFSCPLCSKPFTQLFHKNDTNNNISIIQKKKSSEIPKEPFSLHKSDKILTNVNLSNEQSNEQNTKKEFSKSIKKIKNN